MAGRKKFVMRYIVLILLFMGSVSVVLSQSKKERKKQKQEVQTQKHQPSSRDPGSSDNLFRGERRFSKSGNSLEAKAVQEYQQRMKKNAKKYNKIERQKDKPQYSDPMYFGHKRKPKKRPVGKRKFCKVCGIEH
jgi:hypothetical protein